MIYTVYNCPLNTDVYLVGFRFDKTRAGINVKPAIGKLEGRIYSDKFCLNDSDVAYSVNANGNDRYYYFADTYKEAVKKYNELVNEVYKKYCDLTYKIGQNFIGGMSR